MRNHTTHFDGCECFMAEIERLKKENAAMREALIEAKKSIGSTAAEIGKINIDQHGDLHGCDCEGGCNCKPLLWVKLEALKYHCYGSEICVDETLAQLTPDQPKQEQRVAREFWVHRETLKTSREFREGPGWLRVREVLDE